VEQQMGVLVEIVWNGNAPRATRANSQIKGWRRRRQKRREAKVKGPSRVKELYSEA
jgi:hypothetical protein